MNKILLLGSGIGLFFEEACGVQGSWPWVRVVFEVAGTNYIASLLLAFASGVKGIDISRLWAQSARKFRRHH